MAGTRAALWYDVSDRRGTWNLEFVRYEGLQESNASSFFPENVIAITARFT
jgi:hypothetical protein